MKRCLNIIVQFSKKKTPDLILVKVAELNDVHKRGLPVFNALRRLAVH